MSVGKISVSLEQPLLDFLAHYQNLHQVRSKSEVVAQALMLLRDQLLEAQYEAALHEWNESGDAALWETTVGDALQEGTDAPR